MKHPQLALSMIVRDAGRDLAACLASCPPTVEEILIADTGSRDNTVEVAKGFGAKVVNVAWTNDFAAARNAALRDIRSEWILSLDADERLDPDAGNQLPALLNNEAVAGYQVSIRNYLLNTTERLWDRAATRNDFRLDEAKPYPAYAEHANVRLFRRNPKIYFVGRVHESVGPRILEAGLKLGTANFCIHHFGLAVDFETRKRKNSFYRELGVQKLKEIPGDSQAHFELGLMELDNLADVPEALRLFQAARHLNPHFAEAWLFEGFALVKLERYRPALVALSQAERRGHRTSLVAEMAGEAHYNLGEFARAVESFRLAHRRSPEAANIESKLGMALVRVGQTQTGLQSLQRAINAEPSTGELHDRFVQALVWLDRIEEAAAAAHAKLGALELPTEQDFLRAASLWSKVGNVPRSAAVLQVGLQCYPDKEVLRHSLEKLARQPAL
jgi:tetratricopeptide (TPR) repeat protein